MTATEQTFYDAENFAKYARQISLPATACLLLRGPVTLNEFPQGTAWFESIDVNWLPLPVSPYAY